MGESGQSLVKSCACFTLGVDADMSSAELKPVYGEQQNYDSTTDSEVPQREKISERKLMAKIDLHLLPCLCILYLLAFLDRQVSCGILLCNTV